MISFLENKDIDRSRWDTLVSQSPNGLIYSRSWFLDVVCEKWNALIEDDYLAVLPLPSRKKYGIEYAFQPFYANQFGIISRENVGEQKVNSFLQSIPEKFKYIDIMLNFQNKASASNYTVNERKAQFIQLGSPYDELKKKYDNNLKRNLSKAEKAGVTIQAGVSPEKVTEYFKEGRGKELGNFSSKDYLVLTNILREAIMKEMGFTLGAFLNEELLAAAGFLSDDKRIIFVKGGSSGKGKELGAMHMIMNDVIKRYQDKNLLLDFGGSVVPSVARFYKSFGAEDYLYLHVKRNLLPFYLSWLKK